MSYGISAISGGNLKFSQRLGQLDRVERLLLVGDKRAGPGRDIAEPVARRRHLAAIDLPDVGDEFLDVRHVGLQPIPFEYPGADARLGRQAFEHLQLLLRAGDVEALVETELHCLFQRS